MIRGVLALIAGVSLGWGAMTTSAINPPPPEQRNPDVYEVPGYPSPKLQTLNPLTQALKAGATTVRFKYVVMPGCSDGDMRSTLQAALDTAPILDANGHSFRFVEDNINPQMTIRANCGSTFANICGGPPVIACLGRGWPYVDDVDATTTMATFYDQSQEAIWLHEIFGHALFTWNEQYLLDGTFAPAPGLIDFMSTGPNSRYIWPANDLDRVSRTMWDLAPVPEWGDCNADANNVWCWNNKDSLWHLTQWAPTEWRSNGGPWFCVAHCP